MRPRYLLEIVGVLLIAATGCAGVTAWEGFSSTAGGPVPPIVNLQEEVVKAARSLVGMSCPEGRPEPTEFDCNRYIPDVYHKATGITLPPKPDDLAKSGRPVTKEELRPGDIVYFTIEREESVHPGIYIGGGDFVHASNSGGVVAIQSLDQDYWRIRFLGARRVLRGGFQS
ncbi:MAG: C40 family peptidase [Nitrospirae bacterium]|nr:C40 family peptidase [Nitrospirota bacterium]